MIYPKDKPAEVVKELNLRTRSQWAVMLDRSEEENTEMRNALADIKRRVSEYEERLQM